MPQNRNMHVGAEYEYMLWFKFFLGLKFFKPV